MSIVTKIPNVSAQSNLLLPLMKALDWAETLGNFVTIDICPSIHLASEVLNPQSAGLLVHRTFDHKGFHLLSKFL